ncbi:MAG: hypothetical protein LBD20_08745 [Spirochaetaceae bacterium]|nr:hypothetical protein [Spirochaetaceae bacterium]
MQQALLIIFIDITANIYALDIKYTDIVNTALSDLKTHTKLSLLQGHVAINISSGNKEFDAQFADVLQNAYPNFAAKADSVNHEDLYQMSVKVHRENNDVYIYTTVTNFEKKNIVERTVKAKNVSAAVLETLQYKTAIHAKNEFEAYLNETFTNTGAVVQEARVIPPPPPKPPPPPFDWSPFTHYENWFDISFGVTTLFESDFLLIMPQIGLEWGGLDGIIKRWRFGTYISLPGYAHLRLDIGVILPYNKYLLFPIGIGAEFNMYINDSNHIKDRVEDEYGTSWGFVFSPGVMIKIKSFFIIGRYTIGKHEIDNNFEFILGWVF